jgi:hypothetical protein
MHRISIKTPDFSVQTSAIFNHLPKEHIKQLRNIKPKVIYTCYNIRYNMRNNVVRKSGKGAGDETDPLLQASVHEGTAVSAGHQTDRGYGKDRPHNTGEVRKTLQAVHKQVLRKIEPDPRRDRAVLSPDAGGHHRMEKSGKIICGCGGEFRVELSSFGEFDAPALVCAHCGHTTLTKEQAMEVMRLRQMHETIDSDRKLIRIGNSFGLTLPERLQDHGIKVGQKVRLRALTPHSFEVILPSS